MSKKRKRRRRRGLRVHRLTEPGAAPGTVTSRPDAPRPMIDVLVYDTEALSEYRIDDARQLQAFLHGPGVKWINICGLGDAELIEEVGAQLNLHALALEDVVNVPQRAKVEDYGNHLFIVARMISWNGVLETEQISMFLGSNFVLTFQERVGDCFDPVRERMRSGRGRIRKSGADYLLYALLDAVVDSYFPIVDTFGEQMESLDDSLATQHAPDVLHQVHEIRSDMMILRRAIRPMRDALLELMPDRNSHINHETHVFFRDCYDHIVQLIELLDTYREMCSDLRDYCLSCVSNRMNDVMKVLTIIATIFIPLSFIAGLYGMNFQDMPELRWPFGYPMALALMFAVAAGLLTFFWRRGWLSNSTLSHPDSNSDYAQDRNG